MTGVTVSLITGIGGGISISILCLAIFGFFCASESGGSENE